MALHFGMAWSLSAAKQYREAIQHARRALEIDPNFFQILLAMGLVQLHAGFAEEAIASLKRAVELVPWHNMSAWSLTAAYYQAGDRERSQEWTRKLAESHGHTVGAALYHAVAGEVDAMFEALDEAHRRREVFLLFIQNQPYFDPYRADPRYQALLQKMNLV